jgi:hypothetical protein
MPGSSPSIATPILEGPYGPNRVLDFCTRLMECPAPDNLVWQDDHLLFTSGPAVLLLDGLHDHSPQAEEILRFERAVTAMAAAADGSLAIGLDGAGIAIVGGAHDGRTIQTIGATGGSVTVLCFADPHTLFACIQSAGDDKGTDGALWRLDLRSTEPLCLVADLAGPAGLLLQNFDTLVVSEGGRRRLLECSTNAPRQPRVMLDDLPGKPGRLAWGSGGNVWLTIPTLGLPTTAPSYGLIIRLDADFVPRGSLHGASDGRSRGVTSCLEARGELIVACRADNVLISIDLVDEVET